MARRVHKRFLNYNVITRFEVKHLTNVTRRINY